MSNPWTPEPWGVEDCQGEGSVYIVASGNPLLTRGRSRRAKTHRAMLAAAPEMAEVLDGTTGAFLAVLLERMAANLEMLGTSADNDLVVEARSRAVKIRALLSRIRGDQP